MPNKKSIRNNTNKKKLPKPILTQEENEKKFNTLLDKRWDGLDFQHKLYGQRSKELYIKTYEEIYSIACPKELIKFLNFGPSMHLKKPKTLKNEKAKWEDLGIKDVIVSKYQNV